MKLTEWAKECSANTPSGLVPYPSPMTKKGHLEALPPPRSNASCLIRKEASGRTRRNGSVDRGPSAYHTDAGKALSFSAAGPANCPRCRLPGMQTRELRDQNAQDSNRGVDAAGNLVNVG